MRMSVLLKDKQHVEAFREFLKEEHADENLAFFLAVEELKQCQMLLERRNVVEKLFSSFIVDDAPRQVNLPSSIRVKLLQNRENFGDVEMFDAAQQEVLSTLRTNSLSRFLESCFYTGLVKRGFS
jgi:hypothetical protein